ncbi:MAG: nucleotidyltransferase family protein, partial [Lachnospiraceae bacterium]|nr:nucleotidyltransferase family protein [Lachnospiraceae bacterium]
LGLGNEVECPLPPDLDWQAVIDRAGKIGLDAVAWDGLQALYELRPGMAEALDESLGEIKYDWFGYVLQAEQDYDAYRRTLRDLASFYNGAGMPVMVLKGYGLSLHYPVPRHRPTGDIDIYLFGRWKEADRLLEAQLGIKADNSHHHHSTFQFDGRLVENHYDLINIHSRPSNRRLEPLLKELAGRSPVECEVDDARILLPCADFNALFLLRHAAGHFASVDINLRHVLDWLLFIRAHGSEVDWPWIYGVLERENMVHFANSLNAIGVRYLGFEPSLFPAVETDGALVDRVFGEILHPAFTDKEDGTLAHSLWVKPARWWSNRWKYRLVFADSLPAAFLHSLFAKFLKPKSFVH